MLKVIVRIRGGLGNQLFCYAAARRLALVNQAELVIDDVTGFSRDRTYQRKYMLDHFTIPVRKAVAAERLEPFERYRRGLEKFVARKRPFHKRSYVEQEGSEFDPRLLDLSLVKRVYLDGLWQSEGYFKDIEATIREDLKIIPPVDVLNLQMAEKMRNCNSVALHVRWFAVPGSSSPFNVSAHYYQRAIQMMDELLCSPRYFVFSDNPEAARSALALDEARTSFVSHNRGDQNAYADLWLMAQCRHVITANSTFSWWGAWLGECNNKVVIVPSITLSGVMAWGFTGLIPERWLQI